jgi:hypothetical protein
LGPSVMGVSSLTAPSTWPCKYSSLACGTHNWATFRGVVGLGSVPSSPSPNPRSSPPTPPPSHSTLQSNQSTPSQYPIFLPHATTAVCHSSFSFPPTIWAVRFPTWCANCPHWKVQLGAWSTASASVLGVGRFAPLNAWLYRTGHSTALQRA